MPSNILVIGSEGTIGRSLVKELESCKSEVVLGDRIYTCDRTRIKRDKYWMGDISHFVTMEKVFFETNPDIVIHLAGEVSRETAEYWPEIAIESNVLGTFNVAKLCHEFGAIMVYAGTSEEYGNMYVGLKEGEYVTEELVGPPRCKGVYGLTKWMGEEMIEYFSRRYGLRAIVPKLFMCYGPGEYPSPYRSAMSRFIYSALHDLDIHVHKDTSRSWCYIDDIVEGFIKIINLAKGLTVKRSTWRKAGYFEIFNLGRDEVIGTEDLARYIISQVVSSSKVILEDAPEGITPHKKASFEKAKKMLNWEAKVPLIEGVTKTIEWQTKMTEEGKI